MCRVAGACVAVAALALREESAFLRRPASRVAAVLAFAFALAIGTWLVTRRYTLVVAAEKRRQAQRAAQRHSGGDAGGGGGGGARTQMSQQARAFRMPFGASPAGGDLLRDEASTASNLARRLGVPRVSS